MKEIPNSILISCYIYGDERFIDCDRLAEVGTENLVNISYILSTRDWLAFEKPASSLKSCEYRKNDDKWINAIMYPNKNSDKIFKKGSTQRELFVLFYHIKSPLLDPNYESSRTKQ